MQLFSNNGKSTLASAVTSSGQTSLTLATGTGALFPSPTGSDYFLITLDDNANVEICKCTARSGDTLTVLRGQEGTVAQSSFAAGTKAESRGTRDTLANFLQLSGGGAITGNADAVELLVKGNATQTTNILEVQKSDATSLMSVSNAGLLTAVSLKATGLTSGRIPVAGAAGLVGDFANLTYGSGKLAIADATASTSTSTGALVLSGSGAGLGVAGAGVFGGNITITKTTVASELYLNSTAGYERNILFQSGGSTRWIIRIDNTAESGSDAGSNWNLVARTDAGAAIDATISIVRAAGGLFNTNRPFATASTTDASAIGTAAFVCAGGGSFGKSVFIGGQLTLAGDPTANKSLTFGTSSVLSQVGTRRNGGQSYFAANATSAAASDLWTQSSGGFGSFLVIFDSAGGLLLKNAAAGTTAGTYATFWGSSIFTISNTGAVTAPGLINNSNTTEASAIGTAALVTAGGLSVAKKAYHGDIIVVPKTSGKGIQVDTTTPTWGWRDITGYINVDASGANAATLSAFMGGSIRRWAFSATDKADCEFHIPHDYAPGTDLYIHYHWAHNGTAISGNIVGTFVHTYAKGHNQANFSAEKTVTSTYNTTDITTTPRYRHRVEEVQLSTAGGSASLLDTASIEADGIIGVNFTMTTIPTITGGSPNEPFVLCIDLHYQSTNIGTKAKAPDFWT